TDGKWTITSQGVRRKDGKYAFTDIVTGLVYLPKGYENDVLTPIANPILITENKTIKRLNPDLKRPKSMLVRRKYPIHKNLQQALIAIIGGIFQGANKKDFSDAKDLYIIKSMPYPAS